MANSPYTKHKIIKFMSEWYLTNYEDPANSTPCDEGAYVYIWGDPISPKEALGDEFYHLFSEDLIDKAAEQLCKDHDIFEWVPVPVYEDEDDDARKDSESGSKEAP